MSDEKRSRSLQIDVNSIVSKVLRYGVIVSAAVIAIGVLLLVIGTRTPNYPDSLTNLIQANYGRPSLNLYSLLYGVVHLKGGYLIQLGLLILLATPLIRVATSLVLFAASRDFLYVVVTLIVLVVLILSVFVVGPYEAGL